MYLKDCFISPHEEELPSSLFIAALGCHQSFAIPNSAEVNTLEHTHMSVGKKL